MNMEHRWNDMEREKRKYAKQNLSHCHFSHNRSSSEMARDQTRGSAVKGRPLTASATAQPL